MGSLGNWMVGGGHRQRDRHIRPAKWLTLGDGSWEERLQELAEGQTKDGGWASLIPQLSRVCQGWQLRASASEP